jgi:hypothetical protein
VISEESDWTLLPKSVGSRDSSLILISTLTTMGQIPETAAARRALKVAEIKALLEEAGLATDGTKPVLLERLEEVRSRFYPRMI